jgi:hypothetical protein
MRRVILSVVLVAGALTSAIAVAVAAERPNGTPDSAGAAPAQRLGGIYTDTVSVYESRELSPTVANAAIQAAHDAGGEGVVLNAGTLGIVRWERGGQVLQASAPGYRWPVSVTGFSGDLAGRVLSVRVAKALGAGQVVVGEKWAALRGVIAGDQLAILGWDGAVRTVTVGLVPPVSEVGNPEILASPALAGSWGMTRPSSVAIWGVSSHDAIDAALANRLPKTLIRVRHSWDAPDPDDTLGNSTMKTLLGDFQYAGDGDPITIEAGWRNDNIVAASTPFVGGILCNKNVLPAIQGALNEIGNAGLGGLVYRGAGGCFGPREVRAIGSTTGGSLSRHSYGIALDINTDQNPLGGVPRMDCRVVQIFRKWGFAWGGNFLTSDGMHFEWVNERRDVIASESARSGYCIGAAAPRTYESTTAGVASVPTAPSSLDVLYAPNSTMDQ